MSERKKSPPGVRNRAGLKDVALATGVSVATVSRSFNAPDTVSDKVRQAVLEAARKLGYSPNPAAQALRLQRSYIVGAVFPTTYHGIYSQMVGQFQKRMTEAGYMSFLLTVDFDNSKLYEPVRRLIERGAEALMIVGRIEDPKLIAYLQQMNIPVICGYSALTDEDFPSIGIDNYAATSQVMEYLSQLGHREFAMLAGPTRHNDRQQDRVRAFTDALKRADIAGEPRIFEDPRGYSIEFGLRALQTILVEHPDVTAIVCNSDAYGMAVVAEARRQGMNVPTDLSVTGFDDLDYAAIVEPPLTTVSVSANEMGLFAAEALIGALTENRPIRSHRLQSRLIVRGSTGVAPVR